MKPALMAVVLLGLGLSAWATDTETTPKTLVRVEDLLFLAKPGAAQVQNAFPVRALRFGVNATLSFPCQISDDGALNCQRPRVQQSNGASDLVAAFERAGERLLPMYRVGPQLKSGAPSAGARVLLGLRFQVQDEGL